MAFNFFPKSVEEILDKTAGHPIEANVDEIISAFEFLVSKNPAPIGMSLDRKDKNIVNVMRSLEGAYTMSQIRTGAKLNKLKPKFGNGSLGNRGVNNRGLGFEDVFVTALEKWYVGDTVSNKYILSAIEDLDKTYKMRDAETFLVSAEGAENTKRPLVFAPYIMLTNPKGRGNDVGKSVTDITITLDKGKRTEQEIYISAKYAKTTTFFYATHGEDDGGGAIEYRTGTDLAQGTGVQAMMQGIKGDNDSSGAGYMHLFNPGSTTFVKHFIF